MLATFANKLEAKQIGTESPIIFYEHSLRCPVNVWFEKSFKNKYGWVIQFKASSNSLLDEFRSDIFKQAINYIERRVDRSVTEVSFEELLNLAGALEVNKITVH